MTNILLALVIFCIAWILVLLGLGFLTLSLYFYLITHFSPFISALLCGLFILVIACSLLLILKIFRHIKISRIKKLKIQSTAPSLGFILDKYFKESIIAAAIFGFLVGFSKKIRNSTLEYLNIFIKENFDNSSSKKKNDKPDD